MNSSSQYLSDSFIFQIALLATTSLSLAAYDVLPVSLLVQTMIFVTFNKVITAQYFSWYACLLPVSAPFLLLLTPQKLQESAESSRSRGGYLIICSVVLWLFCAGLWLFNAHKLEFVGEQNFVAVWICSIALRFVNVLVILVVLYIVYSIS